MWNCDTGGILEFFKNICHSHTLFSWYCLSGFQLRLILSLIPFNVWHWFQNHHQFTTKIPQPFNCREYINRALIHKSSNSDAVIIRGDTWLTMGVWATSGHRKSNLRHRKVEWCNIFIRQYVDDMNTPTAALIWLSPTMRTLDLNVLFFLELKQLLS